jgi:hypothetical protein
LRDRKDARAIEEGFFDDFPVELIRKYKLKVSNNFRRKMKEEKKKAQQTKKLESTG